MNAHFIVMMFDETELEDNSQKPKQILLFHSSFLIFEFSQHVVGRCLSLDFKQLKNVGNKTNIHAWALKKIENCL